MRSVGSDTDGIAHGLRQEIFADTAFLYDNRGARGATSLELVGWTDPPVRGHPYRDPRDHGIQAVAYVVADVSATVEQAVAPGDAWSDKSRRLRSCGTLREWRSK